ncbi:MAG: hypothetical protein K0S47_4661 [Herbinix sp.]|jgi:hypothetical protein|nr:hypothetical protein [Herbinix sp.]
MAIYKIYSEEIYPYYKKEIEFLLKARNAEQDKELNIPINLNIILACACYTEGFLESSLKNIVKSYREVFNSIDIEEFSKRKPMNIFFNSIEKDLNTRISQCMGIEKYDSLIQLLLNDSFRKDERMKPLIEPLIVLFQLRNVISHGREVNATEYSSYKTNNLFEEYFYGGYKKAEEFLLKNKIIDKKFIESKDVSVFFSDQVADYFVTVTKDFTKILSLFISGRIEKIKSDNILLT